MPWRNQIHLKCSIHDSSNLMRTRPLPSVRSLILWIQRVFVTYRFPKQPLVLQGRLYPWYLYQMVPCVGKHLGLKKCLNEIKSQIHFTHAHHFLRYHLIQEPWLYRCLGLTCAKIQAFVQSNNFLSERCSCQMYKGGSLFCVCT